MKNQQLSESQNQDPTAKFVSLSSLECLLILTVLIGVVGISGLGVGYYFGANTGVTGTTTKICEGVLKASEALQKSHEGHLQAIQISYDTLKEENARYRGFLLDVDATLDRSHPKTAAAYKGHRNARGGR